VVDWTRRHLAVSYVDKAWAHSTTEPLITANATASSNAAIPNGTIA